MVEFLSLILNRAIGDTVLSEQVISSLNIATAAVVSQLLVIIILSVGAAVIRSGDTRRRPGEVKHDSSSFGWWILALAVVTLGALTASDQIVVLWQPAFGIQENWGIALSTAITTAFTLDIICIFALVSRTRGSRSSEFTSLYFLIPTLAVFLQEPLSRILFYVVGVMIVFTITMQAKPARQEHVEISQSRFAFWFISVACMAVAVFIGYSTRPR